MEIRPKVLSNEERDRVFDVLKMAGHDVIMLVHGEGDDRKVSFYAEGTRMEAQVSYPEVLNGELQEG